MYALFTLLFFIPIFGSDYGMLLSSNQAPTNSLSFEVPTLKTGMQCYNQHSSSSTSLSSPSLTVEISNNNSTLTWSHKHNYAHMFPDITALYRSGHAHDLVKAGADISIWDYMSNPTLRMRKDYINFLTKGENKEQLMRLARILALGSPRSMRVELDRVYKETRDPSQRCQAVILADKQTGGNFIPNIHLPKKEYIPADGNPGQFVDRDFLQELKDKAPYAQELIDVELAKYTVERYRPELWAPFTSDIAYDYLQQVIYISERVPSYHQKEVIDWALLGFYSRLTDPKATMKSHRDAVWNVSDKLANAITKASDSYIKCVPQGIVMLHNDINWLVNNCPREEVAFKTGQRLADAAYFVAYGTALRAAMAGVEVIDAVGVFDGVTKTFSITSNAAQAALSGAAAKTASALARGIVNTIAHVDECVITDKTSRLENWVCKPKSNQEVIDTFKDIKDLGPIEERTIKDKGKMYIRPIEDGYYANTREFSKSCEEGTSTIEFSLENKAIKIRYPGTIQAYEKLLARNKLAIIK